MNSNFYPIYQAAGWLLLYAGLIFAIYLRPWFSPFEYIYAAVLVGSAAVYSHLMRTGFKRWIKEKAFFWQLLYFFFQASLGGAFAGAMLFLSVILLSSAGLTDPIATGHEAVVFNMVFWANAINMVAALLMWSAFYLTTIKARELRDANQALAGSQLDALIQQLSPHFLFNVLNNIRAMILDNPTKARESLAQLADMLRYSLQRDENTKVSLEEELTVVEEYLALCKIQLEDRLSFECEVEDRARTLLIPRMLLQLCVENAIKHGIAKLPAGGTIRLLVRSTDDRLNIALTNPCPKVNNTQPESKKDASGIGLRNINNRLKLMYPKSPHILVRFERRHCRDNPNQDEAEMYIQLPAEYQEAQCE